MAAVGAFTVVKEIPQLRLWDGSSIGVDDGLY